MPSRATQHMGAEALSGELLLLVESAEHAAESGARISGLTGAEVRCCVPEQLSPCVSELQRQGQSPVVVVLSARLSNVIRVAREAARLLPVVQIVFVTREDAEAELTRQLRLAPRIGTNWTLVPESDPQLVRALVLAARSTRQRQQYRTTLHRARARLEEQGELEPVLGAIAQARYRRLAEERLRYQVDLTRSITDNATTAIFMMDAEGRCTFMNPAAEAMTQLRFEEVQGRVLHDFIHHRRPDGRPYPMQECPIDRALPESYEVRNHADVFLRKSGEFFPVVCNARVIYERGVAVGTVLEVRDVTEERKAAEALGESEKRLRFVLDSMPQKVFTATADGHVDYFNPPWTNFSGLSLEQVRASGWTPLLHPDDRDEDARAWRHSIETGEPFQFEHRFLRSDGEYRWHLTRAHALRDDVGAVRMWVGSSTEVHDIKAAEAEAQHRSEQLRQIAIENARLLGELREADQRKTEFLAVLAHELRNPLAPIQSGLEVLRLRGEERGTAGRVLDTMEGQVRQLVRLIDDLLDVSRISKGRLELKTTRVELEEVVAVALDTVQPLLDAARTEFTKVLPVSPVVLNGDPARLAQVVANLLHNAAKYTPAGGSITLSAQPRGDEVILSVKDTGQGIPTDMLASVFEMFTQVDRTLDRSQGGLGIGLHLVKRIVEMHGGKVEARSDGVGRGSELVVCLPLAPQAKAFEQPRRADEKVSKPGPGRRILVADDNRDAADTLRWLLEAQGHEVITAYDGQMAFEAAEAHRPDLALLDIGMPRLNGYEVAQHIQREPWGRSIHLVALSGWGQLEDRQRSKEAGFDRHLVKPVDTAELNRVIAEFRRVD